MKFINNSTAIILFIQNKPIRVEKTDKKYPKIIATFSLPEDQQEDAILAILKPEETKVESIHGQNGFEVVGSDIFYKGGKLPVAFATKIKSIIRDGLPVTHFEKFWENLEQNPSANSINELVDFLSNKELPITEDGYFLAYKGLNPNFYSVHGNKDTKVLTGTVNSSGQIYNGVGEYISVARNQVDDDRNVHCSFGLHAGQLEYVRGFGSKVVIVKINPKDVVSVPTDASFMKCRVCAYEVIGEFTGEIESSVVAKNGEEIIPNAVKERNEFVNRVDTYISKKRAAGFEEVTVKQIQNSFSPAYPSRVAVLEALQELGELWSVNDDGVYVVTL
jgi:hypothetical protein